MSQSIGIRQLKAELSQLLRRVEGGEQIIVTDRGAPIAAPPGAICVPEKVDPVTKQVTQATSKQNSTRSNKFRTDTGNQSPKPER